MSPDILKKYLRDAIPIGDHPAPYAEWVSVRLDVVQAALGRLDAPEGFMFDAFGEPRVRYVRITLDGQHCVVKPEDVADHTAQGTLLEEDTHPYILTDTYLSEREFEDLPEFDGF